MKTKIMFAVLVAVSLPSHAFQKCTDSDGRITYADFCTTDESVKVESMYIADTYDAEADRQAQLNTLALEQQTRQSQYERYQRNSRNRQVSTSASVSTYNSGNQAEADKYFKKAERLMKRMPYGGPGDRAKRDSMLAQARQLQNMGRAKMGQSAVPSPARGSSSAQVDSSRRYDDGFDAGERYEKKKQKQRDLARIID